MSEKISLDSSGTNIEKSACISKFSGIWISRPKSLSLYCHARRYGGRAGERAGGRKTVQNDSRRCGDGSRKTVAIR